MRVPTDGKRLEMSSAVSARGRLAMPTMMMAATAKMPKKMRKVQATEPSAQAIPRNSASRPHASASRPHTTAPVPNSALGATSSRTCSV